MSNQDVSDRNVIQERRKGLLLRHWVTALKTLREEQIRGLRQQNEIGTMRLNPMKLPGFDYYFFTDQVGVPMQINLINPMNKRL